MTAPWCAARCDLGGLTVHVRRRGVGAPLVMLHGLFGSGAGWAPVADPLAAEFDVVLPDARGHGDSDAPAAGYRYDDLADDVVGLVRALGLARPILVGHSMGGLTAAVVAARAPALLRGLVLVDPTFLGPDRQREVHASGVAAEHDVALATPRAALIAAAQQRQPRRSPALIAAQVDARRATRRAALAVLTPPNPPYREVVRAIVAPTLLVIGDRPVVTPAVAAELRDLNPRIEVAEVADAGHGLPFDQPAALAALIAAFARGLA